ncbi:MAG: hypothetical protein PVI24_06110, partial [Myxococcales bacterium]
MPTGGSDDQDFLGGLAIPKPSDDPNCLVCPGFSGPIHDLASTGAAPARIRELEALGNRQERHVKELGAMLAPLDLPRPEDVVARIRDLGALFDKSPKDAREALKHLLDDGIQLHPLEDGRYRARWTVRGGALFFAGTTKSPRCKPRALKSGQRCG